MHKGTANFFLLGRQKFFQGGKGITPLAFSWLWNGMQEDAIVHFFCYSDTKILEREKYQEKWKIKLATKSIKSYGPGFYHIAWIHQKWECETIIERKIGKVSRWLLSWATYDWHLVSVIIQFKCWELKAQWQRVINTWMFLTLASICLHGMMNLCTAYYKLSK